MNCPFGYPDYLPGRSVKSVHPAISVNSRLLQSAESALPVSCCAVWHISGVSSLTIAFCLLTQSVKNVLPSFRRLNEPPGFTPFGSHFGSSNVPSLWVGLKQFRVQLSSFLCFHFIRAAFYHSPGNIKFTTNFFRNKIFLKNSVNQILNNVINNC